MVRKYNKVDAEINELIELLKSIYPVVNSHQELKASILYEYARMIEKDEVIVELGTFRGMSAISLCKGAEKHGAIVHTVDSYTLRRGWAGEEYVTGDLATAMSAFEKAHVKPIMHMGDFTIVPKTWKYPTVDLLFYDGGSYGLVNHCFAWEHKISVGGQILVHDTADQKLGSKRLFAALTSAGNWFPASKIESGFWSITKKAAS